MRTQKKIAVEVLELANEFTGWNFGIAQNGSTYFVGTTLHNQKGQAMTIYYLIGEEEAQLTVFSQNCKYNDCNVNERIQAIPLEYPVYVVGMGKNILSINSPMPIEVLNNHMGTIVLKRMVDMVQAMTDIINSCG